MAVRNIVKIDEEKCTGCGQCVTACAEGAIKIIDGKAKIVSDSYCDGLGACLGHCPEDAITIEQRDAAEFDEQAVKAYLGRADSQEPKREAIPFACPGLMPMQLQTEESDRDVPAEAVASQLRHWPVQLNLMSPKAACLADADLLLAADCVPFAMGDFHQRFLKGRSVVVGCPKLDDAASYIEKVADIIRSNNLRSLTVVHMEVPCCSGLVRVAREAISRSNKPMSFEDVTISLRGKILQSQTVKIGQLSEAESGTRA